MKTYRTWTFINIGLAMFNGAFYYSHPVGNAFSLWACGLCTATAFSNFLEWMMPSNGR